MYSGIGVVVHNRALWREFFFAMLRFVSRVFTTALNSQHNPCSGEEKYLHRPVRHIAVLLAMTMAGGFRWSARSGGVN